MVLPDSHEISRVSQYSGTGLLPFDFRYGAITRFGATFQTLPLRTHRSIMPALQPRCDESHRFRLFPFRSPLLWESRLISSPTGTEMFHFPAFASPYLCIQHGMTESLPPGFPIQKSPDQRMLGSSPRLIAAVRVFHRLPAPRHPPVALFILVILLLLRPRETSYDASLRLSFPTLFNCQ